jgi:predicted Fe-Mo cluster-binding NifX family protein
MKRCRQSRSPAKPVRAEPFSPTKAGLTVVRPDAEAPLSPQFGLAGWVLICDTDRGEPMFERNPLLYGMGVIDILERHRCTDVIFSSIGRGALEALKAAGIRGWCGPEGVPAARLIERLKRGELEKASENARDH